MSSLTVEGEGTTPISTESVRRRERVLVLDEHERLHALADWFGTRSELVVCREVEEALAAAHEWLLDVDLVVVELSPDGAQTFDAVVDLAIALPGTATIVVCEVGALREEAVQRGCVAAYSLAEVDGEATRGALESLLGDRDLRGQWAARFGQMRMLFSALDVGVVVISPTGRVVVANLLANELLGQPRSALLYQRNLDFGLQTLEGMPVPPEERLVERVLTSGEPSEPVQRLIHLPSGAQRILELRAAPMAPMRGPGATAVVITGRDVTEQLAVQRALIQAERRDSLLLEHAAEGYVVLDRHGIVTEASPTLARYYPMEWLLGSDARLLLHADERDRAAAMFVSVRDRPGTPVRAEVRFVEGHGDERWAELTMTNRLDEPAIGGVVLNLRDITERKVAEESMAQLSAIVEFSEDSIIAETLDGTITSWNPASARLYGYSAEEAIGSSSMELVVPPNRRGELQEIWERLRSGERVERRDSLRIRKDGSRVIVSVHVSPVYDATGRLVGTSTIARDVSERRRLEEERSMFEERFRVGFERGAIGMSMLDLRRRFTRVNRALCTILGRSEEELVGHVVETFVHPLEVELAIQASSAQVSGGVDHYHGERRFVRKDGEDVWATVDSTVVRQADGSPIYVFSQFQDITDRKRSEQALAHNALHDALTELPNRALLYDRLGQAIDRGSRNVSQIALLFLDLDRFQLVNDGLGHAAGDKLLVDIGKRLVDALRRSDTVARVGGDEFIVMREDVDATEAVELGDQVIALFQEPFVLDGVDLHVSASCGVVLVNGESSIDETLRDADAAMYRAKERGGARVELSNPELRRAVSQRFDLERALAFAIERNEFRVVYQPIVSMETGRLIGTEALVRWEQPQWGLLLPAEFIPAAEETGHITAIGAFVLNEALAQVMRWRSALPGAEQLWVSVNLSSRQLALTDPVSLSALALAELNAPADALRLELTESAVMEDVDAAIELLSELRRIGIKIAIDDFGTGHSSLSYLSRLPISSLKIDHSFVWALGPAREDSAIVRAIVSLADTLNIEPCAEGVETEEQRRILSDLGCGLAQGYLFAPPMAPEEFEHWLRGRVTPAGVA